MARPTLRDVHPTTAPLTNVSIMYKNEQYIWPEVFPQVPVTKKNDAYFIFPKEYWFRNRSGPRAPGTEAPLGEYGLTTASYVCINDSLATLIPDEVRDNADAPLAPDIEAVEFVTDGLQLACEIRVATLVTTSTNWATSSSPTTQWSSDTSDPWGDIMTAYNGVVSQIGRKPNVAVMSWDVWRYLANHPDFLDRVKYTRPSGRVEPGDLRSWFGFDKVLVGTSLKESAQEGKSSSMTYVWADDFWCGYVPATPSLRTPAAGYVFVWKQRTLNKFRLDTRHADRVEIEWFTDEKITASDAGGICYDAI